MFGDERGSLDRGSKVGCVCSDCGDRFTHIEKVKQDPPRSTSMCPDCYPTKERVSSAMVAGTWRINDDVTRAMFVSLIEENTDYSVYVKERVGDLYVYDPDQLEDEE